MPYSLTSTACRFFDQTFPRCPLSSLDWMNIILENRLAFSSFSSFQGLSSHMNLKIFHFTLAAAPFRCSVAWPCTEPKSCSCHSFWSVISSLTGGEGWLIEHKKKKLNLFDSSRGDAATVILLSLPAIFSQNKSTIMVSEYYTLMARNFHLYDHACISK